MNQITLLQKLNGKNEMKIAIIHYVAGISSKSLAEALRYNGITADVFKLSKDGPPDPRAGYTHVFSYGAGFAGAYPNRINEAAAVLRCVDKTQTFDALKKAGCNTVEYCTRKQDIPKHWETVVVRTKIDGRKAEGLDYHENDGRIPDGALFSEYFEHKFEYRIMVFKGVVVGRYFKAEKEGDWYFNVQPKKGFEIMDDHCIRAAKALGIDYVGFDVVANTKKDFRILEANSAPRITDEAENAIVEYYINL
jgi:glutathione synthase/RimK-type ligase-like ATP-grasp enzyme